jgi:succinoglycan biosynthesis transport protein ExoP
MRHVKMSLQNAVPDQGPIRIGVVSLLPGEGKSTVAANLAALFAASGSPTLLIDADTRSASLSRWLAPSARRGLCEALAGEADGVIAFDRGTDFHFLPLAGGEQASPSAELLVSPAAGHLLHHLEARYATVIVDLPALCSAADARALGRSLDGYVLVGEWGRAPLEAVKEAVTLLRADRVRLLGVVINKVEEGIPPLFGLHLADLRRTVEIAYVNPAVQAGS